VSGKGKEQELERLSIRRIRGRSQEKRKTEKDGKKIVGENGDSFG